MDNLPVIVAVDGSADSERALHWAAEAARLRSAPMQVVHVWPYVTSARAAAAEAGTGDPVLDELRAKLAAEAVELPETEFRSLSGLSDTQLPALGAEGQLLVLGSRGRGGFASLLLGSNGMACAAQAGCPVVVVPRPDRGGTERGADGEAVRPAVRQVTLGVDASSDEPGAIGFAFAEASRRGARLKVVSGYSWPMVTPPAFEYVAVYEASQQEYEDALGKQLADELAPHRTRHPEVEVEVELRNADAAGQLVEASRTSDLVVVARHRRRLPVGPRLGSVAHAVLLHAVCPIAVVPEGTGTGGNERGAGSAAG
ncbi:universal stress protein [Streptomyces celluloflavus]|uniref:Universal stress protein n=2 Tax=Streptomyces TaxID=1883 RepID=A0A4Q9HRX4_STRKA|nr:universal stress protein [Streptomyces kasugaensis]TBO57727.1 universal stress protein [Streptomyces kasugaensis]WSK12178.1 universal stress protein [Streptomyces celluloflavus]